MTHRPRAAGDRPQVPQRMRQHREDVADDGRHDAREPRAARRGDPHTDPDEDGEHRVREGRHETPCDERPRERGAATLTPRPGEVVDVLREGEAGGADGGIDHPVGDAVELTPQHPPRQEHEGTLGRLLHDRGDEHRRRHHRRLRVAGRNRLQDRDGARVEQGRDDGRDEPAPEERRDEVAGRFGLEAVQPEEGRDDDAERDQRHGECEQRRLDAERRAEVGGHDERGDEETRLPRHR